MPVENTFCFELRLGFHHYSVALIFLQPLVIDLVFIDYRSKGLTFFDTKNRFVALRRMVKYEFRTLIESQMTEN